MTLLALLTSSPLLRSAELETAPVRVYSDSVLHESPYVTALKRLGVPHRLYSKERDGQYAQARFYQDLTNAPTRTRLAIIDLQTVGLVSDPNDTSALAGARASLSAHLSQGGRAIIPFDEETGRQLGLAADTSPISIYLNFYRFGYVLYDWGGSALFEGGSGLGLDEVSLALIRQRGSLLSQRPLAGFKPHPDTSFNGVQSGGEAIVSVNSDQVLVTAFSLSQIPYPDTRIYLQQRISFAERVVAWMLSQETTAPPTLLGGEKTSRIDRGREFTMVARVAGSHPMTFQWYRNGTEMIPSATNAFFTLRASLTNGGEYSVVISNRMGVARGKVTEVTTVSTPLITMISSTQQVVPGGNARAMTSVARTEILKNPRTGLDEPLESVANHGQDRDRFVPVEIEMKPDSSVWVTYNDVLVISNAMTGLGAFNFGPQGKMFFSGRTGSGFQNLWIDNLRIETFSFPRAPFPTSLAVTTASAKPGDSLRLRGAVNSDIPATYRWFRNGQPISGATALDYTIPQVRPETANDLYRFEASNGYGTYSRELRVQVLAPPEIVQYPDNLTAGIGADVQFRVTVSNTATLPLSYTWSVNQTTLFSANLMSHEAELVISNVTPLSAGSYVVTVTNSAGSARSDTTASGQLTVIEAGARPSLRWIAPVDGARIDPAASVRLIADASDADGTIRRVDFYRDGEFLGSATHPPFELLWLSPFEGPNVLQAVAVDDRWIKSAPAVSEVTVRPPGTLRILATELTAGGLKIAWKGTPGALFQLEFTTRLESGLWVLKESSILAGPDGTATAVIDLDSHQHAFFRISTP